MKCDICGSINSAHMHYLRKKSQKFQLYLNEPKSWPLDYPKKSWPPDYQKTRAVPRLSKKEKKIKEQTPRLSKNEKRTDPLWEAWSYIPNPKFSSFDFSFRPSSMSAIFLIFSFSSETKSYIYFKYFEYGFKNWYS